MKEIISSIQENLAKIETGNITMSEIEQLVSDSRELNERLIVLRYKVYEQGVLGYDTLEIDEAPLSSSEFMIDESEPEKEATEEAPSNVEVSTNSTNSSQVYEMPFELNLFSENIEPETVENLENHSNEILIEETTFISSNMNEELGVEEEIIVHHETSIVEEEQTTFVIEKEEITTVTTFNNIEEEVTPSIETEIKVEVSESPVTTENSDNEIINKIKTIELSLRSNYSIMPLDTLVGSFTLNERLQFINELFDGSSDSFSTAVKKLDSQSNLISAREQVAEFATNNSWDLESEIVEDFLVKICRRYAADLTA